MAMPSSAQLTLTDFVEIVSRSGTAKAAKVAQVKARPPYEPAYDFYKPVREGLIQIHRGKKDRNALVDIVARQTDPKKLAHYPNVIAGYKRWWGAKNFTWFSPPKSLYTKHGVAVVVNPELGLVYKDAPHII